MADPHYQGSQRNRQHRRNLSSVGSAASLFADNPGQSYDPFAQISQGDDMAQSLPQQNWDQPISTISTIQEEDTETEQEYVQQSPQDWTPVHYPGYRYNPTTNSYEVDPDWQYTEEGQQYAQQSGYDEQQTYHQQSYEQGYGTQNYDQQQYPYGQQQTQQAYNAETQHTQNYQTTDQTVDEEEDWYAQEEKEYNRYLENQQNESLNNNTNNADSQNWQNQDLQPERSIIEQGKTPEPETEVQYDWNTGSSNAYDNETWEQDGYQYTAQDQNWAGQESYEDSNQPVEQGWESVEQYSVPQPSVTVTPSVPLPPKAAPASTSSAAIPPPPKQNNPPATILAPPRMSSPVLRARSPLATTSPVTYQESPVEAPYVASPPRSKTPVAAPPPRSQTPVAAAPRSKTPGLPVSRSRTPVSSAQDYQTIPPVPPLPSQDSQAELTGIRNRLNRSASNASMTSTTSTRTGTSRITSPTPSRRILSPPPLPTSSTAYKSAISTVTATGKRVVSPPSFPGKSSLGRSLGKRIGGALPAAGGWSSFNVDSESSQVSGRAESVVSSHSTTTENPLNKSLGQGQYSPSDTESSRFSPRLTSNTERSNYSRTSTGNSVPRVTSPPPIALHSSHPSNASSISAIERTQILMEGSKAASFAAEALAAASGPYPSRPAVSTQPQRSQTQTQLQPQSQTQAKQEIQTQPQAQIHSTTQSSQPQQARPRGHGHGSSLKSLKGDEAFSLPNVPLVTTTPVSPPQQPAQLPSQSNVQPPLASAPQASIPPPSKSSTIPPPPRASIPPPPKASVPAANIPPPPKANAPPPNIPPPPKASAPVASIPPPPKSSVPPPPKSAENSIAPPPKSSGSQRAKTPVGRPKPKYAIFQAPPVPPIPAAESVEEIKPEIKQEADEPRLPESHNTSQLTTIVKSEQDESFGYMNDQNQSHPHDNSETNYGEWTGQSEISQGYDYVASYGSYDEQGAYNNYDSYGQDASPGQEVQSAKGEKIKEEVNVSQEYNDYYGGQEYSQPQGVDKEGDEQQIYDSQGQQDYPGYPDGNDSQNYDQQNYDEQVYDQQGYDYSQEGYSQPAEGQLLDYSQESQQSYNDNQQDYSQQQNDQYYSEQQSDDVYGQYDNYQAYDQPVDNNQPFGVQAHGQDYSQQDYSQQPDYSQQDYSQQDYSQQDYSQQDYSQQDYSQQDYSQQDYSQQHDLIGQDLAYAPPAATSYDDANHDSYNQTYDSQNYSQYQEPQFALTNATPNPQDQYSYESNDLPADLGLHRSTAPVVSFGFGGQIVLVFPGGSRSEYNGNPDLYGNASMDVASPSTVQIRKFVDLYGSTESTTFPGPLFMDGNSKSNVGKKRKEAVTWLESRITELTQETNVFTGPDATGLSGLSEAEQKEKARKVKSRLTLIKVIKCLVENEGKLSGSPKIEEAIRSILAPHASPSVSTDNDFTIASDLALGGSRISKSAGSPFTSYPVSSVNLDEVTSFLLKGERRKAVEYALENKLWAHAFIISSCVDTECWKEVVNEFLRSELTPNSGSGDEGRDGLRVAYSVFAGCGAESANHMLVHRPLGNATSSLLQIGPSHSGILTPRATTPGLSSSDSLISQSALDNWQETVAMIVANRTAGDSAALTSLGDVLLANGCVDGAHVCYLLSPATSLFAGPQTMGVRMSLVGSQVTSGSIDLESVMLTELAEFAFSLAPIPKGQEPFIGFPHLQAYKLFHGTILADAGQISQAHRYTEAIAGVLKLSNKPVQSYTPDLISELRRLSERLSGAPGKEQGSWIARKVARPTIDSLWTGLEGRFTKFVAGEGRETVEKKVETSSNDIGPFSHYSSIGPSGVSSAPTSGPPTAGLQPGVPMGPRSITPSIGRSVTPSVGPSPLGGESLSLPPTRPMTVSPAPTQQPTLVPPTSKGRFGKTHHSRSSSLGAFAGYNYDPNAPPPWHKYEAEKADTTPPSSSPVENENPPAPVFAKTDQKFEVDDSGFINTMGAYAPPIITPSTETPAPTPSHRRTTTQDEIDALGFSNSRSKKPTFDAIDEQEDGEESATDKPQDGSKPNSLAPPKSGVTPAAPTIKPSRSWLGGWFKREASPGPTKEPPIKANLGETSSFVFDPELKKWVNKKAGETSSAPAIAPPPRASTASPSKLHRKTDLIASSTPPPPLNRSKTASNLRDLGSGVAPPPMSSTPSFVGTAPPPRTTGSVPPPPSAGSSRPPSAAGGKRKPLSSRYVPVT